MNGIFWIVLGGMTGWLTGTLMGKEGYGKRSLGGYTRSLDIFFGVVGASIGGRSPWLHCSCGICPANLRRILTF